MKRNTVFFLMCVLCIGASCDIRPQEIASSAITSFGNSAATQFGMLLVEFINTIGETLLGAILMPTP